jgi:tetratricopeptide (TPR) repeat protein
MEWPIVVDESVRDHITERAESQRARVQLIVGASGIGKSTLASAVSSRLEARGFTVLAVIGMPELREIPLGALAPLLASTGAPPSEPTSERLHRLFSLASRAGVKQVLVVDDGPMLDEVSASTVYQLVRVYGMRCVMTARTEHPFTGPLLRLRDEGFVETTEMPAMSTTDAGGIVQRALGSRVEPQSLRAITELAGGNPLFLRGLVLAATQANAVVPGKNGLVVDARALPVRLRDSIALRFADLSTEDRELANLIAVAEPWSEHLLAAPQGLERLERASLVARGADREIYLAHPLFAETLLGMMSDGERSRLRLAAARRLQGSEREDHRFTAVCLLADSPARTSPAELGWAGSYAHTNDDHALAIRLVEQSIDQARERGEDAPFQSYLVRANALSVSGRLAEADHAFAQARADDDRATVATREGFHLAVRLQRPIDAVRMGVLALDTITSDSASASLSANLSKWQLMAGIAPTDTTPVASGSADAVMALDGMLFRMMAAVLAGDLAAVRMVVATARPLAAEAHSAIRHGDELIDFAEFVTLVLDGRVDDAVTMATTAQGEAQAESAGMWSYGLALVALHASRIDDALALATTAVEQLTWRDFLGTLGAATALQATAASLLGRHRLASELLASIGPDARDNIVTQLQTAEAEAWLLAARDETDEAVAVIASATERGVDAHCFAFAGLTAHNAVRLGRPDSVLESLRTIAAASGAESIAAILDHAQALSAAPAVSPAECQARTRERCGQTGTTRKTAREQPWRLVTGRRSR